MKTEFQNVAIALVPANFDVLQSFCEISQAGIASAYENMSLHESAALPHITLSMFCVQNEKLDQVLEGAEQTIIRCRRKEMITEYIGHKGLAVSWLEFESSDNLTKLHLEAMKRRAVYHEQNEESPDVTEGCSFWVKDFDLSAKPYKPHITLGVGDFSIDKLPLDIDFELGLFEIHGNCQIRKLNS